MPTLRDQMVELATAAIRLHDPQPEYLALVAHGETPAAARGMARASGCGLVVRGLWWLVGLRDPRLEAPYKTGSVMTTIGEMATESNAWRAATWAGSGVDGPLPPNPGDVLFLGPSETIASEHAATIVDCYAADGVLTVNTIDGGQRLMGAEGVCRCVRVLRARAGHVTTDGARPVLGIVDLEKLAARFLP